nr:pentatricopeptide repeat-containing protein, chloroplastic [Quercus suber]
MEVMLACAKYNLVHEFFRKLQKFSIPNALTYKVVVNTLWKEGKTDEALLAVQHMERCQEALKLKQIYCIWSHQQELVSLTLLKSFYTYMNDEISAQDNLIFLQRWFAKFPEYQDRFFFITGESYAGKIKWGSSGALEIKIQLSHSSGLGH